MEHRVVVATAKVRIFKQITTGKSCVAKVERLLLLPQRYEFSSKSQPYSQAIILPSSCCCYRKGTNFQANHNLIKNSVHLLPVVVATAKVRIFKQITTLLLISFNAFWLLLLPQRYEFSSKSQPGHLRHYHILSCCCYRKGTNFQANHNISYGVDPRFLLLLASQSYYKKVKCGKI